MDWHPPSKKIKSLVKEKISDELLIFSYKIAFDALVLLLGVLFIIAMSEAIAPGLILGRVSLTILLIVIFFLLTFINFIHRSIQNNAKNKSGAFIVENKNNKTTQKKSAEILIILVCGFLIVSSIFKTPWWQIIPTTCIALLILIFLHRKFIAKS